MRRGASGFRSSWAEGGEKLVFLLARRRAAPPRDSRARPCAPAPAPRALRSARRARASCGRARRRRQPSWRKISGLTGLVEVVDRARAVAGEHVLIVDQIRRQEHDRDLRDTSCVPLMIWASSKPLTPGI